MAGECMKKFRIYAPTLINSSEETIEQAIPIYEDEYIKYIEIEAEGIGDEYHTIHELYQHRMALNIALFNFIIRLKSLKGTEYWVFKSKFHYDGTMFEDGYFIVGIVYNGDMIISYHYELKYWEKFKVTELERAPKWDGHNSSEVLRRLELL